MELFAIRTGSGKGIYPCNSKEEKAALISKFPQSSYRIFQENERMQALDWIRKSSSGNSRKQIPKTNGNTIIINKTKQATAEGPHPFSQMIEKFRKLGYSGVRITLAGDPSINSFDFWMDSFLYYNSPYHVTALDGRRSYYDSEYRLNISLNGYSYSYPGFNDFKDNFEKQFELLSNTCDGIPFEQALSKSLDKILSQYYGHDKNAILGQMKGAKITFTGNFAYISSAYRTISINNDAITQASPAIKENGAIHDIAINTEQVIKMEPFACKYRVSDKQYADVFWKRLKGTQTES